MCSTVPFKERQNIVNIASLPDNCLAVVNPGLAAQWHPTKNGSLKPDMVTTGSDKKVWWQCNIRHEWQAKISSRSGGCGCPYCFGRNATKGVNDLTTINPKLAAEWHPTKNGSLTPDMVTAGSGKKVWWRCRMGHEWKAFIFSRNKGNGCPYCSGRKTLKGFNDLVTVNPELAAEWHPTKNGSLKPTDVTKSGAAKVWWQCKKGHEWQSTVSNRSRGNNCPYCSGRKTLKGFNDLITINPELAAEWHPTKNGNITPDMVTKNSNKKIWWRCDKGHEWQTTVYHRNNEYDCPYCAGNSLLKGLNDLATANPNLTKEWNLTRNGNLTPDSIIKNSHKKVWWKCSKGHEWQATVSDRSRGNRCPYCSGRRLLKGYNDLATVNPELAAQWHTTKNEGLTPEMMTARSHKKVWWKCSKGHEWQATVSDRSRGNGCPYCAGNSVLKGFNDLATVNPKLAAEWHSTLNGNLTPYDVTRGCHNKVWWQCNKGHEWRATVSSRTKGAGCPFCNCESSTSFPEQAIFFYIKKIFHEAVNRDTSLGVELDIYIPSIMTAIEYDGSYYHTELKKDKLKNLWCKEHGVRLIRIRESKCPDIDESDVIIRKTNDDKSLEDVITDLLSLLKLQNMSVDIEHDRIAIFNNYILNQKENSFSAKYPIVAKEWHPTKNRKLKPDMITPGSRKKIWWRCSEGHEWQATVASRSYGQNCPYCAVKNSINNLATTNPVLAAEWHPTKNGSLTSDMVTKGSGKIVWWQCSKGHEWRARIGGRDEGHGCPYCANKKVIKGFNDLATTNPKLAAEWHPTKNGDLMPDMVTKGSAKKVWWQCDKKHEWQAIIKNRNKSRGCPICYNQKISSSNKKQVL